LQWQVNYPAFPFIFVIAEPEQKDIFDRHRSENGSTHLKYSRHSFSYPHTIVSIPCHGCDVVREYCQVVGGRPFKQRRIGHTGKTDILCAYYNHA